jgi:hypothetical protein
MKIESIKLTEVRVESIITGMVAWVEYMVIDLQSGVCGRACGYSRYLTKGAAYRDLAFKVHPDADIVEFLNFDNQVALRVYK